MCVVTRILIDETQTTSPPTCIFVDMVQYQFLNGVAAWMTWEFDITSGTASLLPFTKLDTGDCLISKCQQIRPFIPASGRTGLKDPSPDQP